MKEKIRLGILGARRGLSFLNLIKNHSELEFEVVVICDSLVSRLDKVKKEHKVNVTDSFDELLKYDIDAVILANYFHQHTPFAIKALAANIHVLSETTPASTMKECVELCEAVEQSDAIYMLAENYAFSKIGLAMKKEYDNNTIGEVLYGEGEYVHPIEVDVFNSISIGDSHWRNWVPSTYYCTHALAPLMYFTNTIPVSVNALSIVRESLLEGTVKRCDPTSVILCRMDNGAVFRLYGWNSPGHSIWYRMHGDKGMFEAPRQYDGGYFGNGQLKISIDPWKSDDNSTNSYGYVPNWPDEYKEAGGSGHGGGDYVVTKKFQQAIDCKKTPEFFDVYRGVSMSAVAILGWKSALANGTPFEIPNFKDKISREKYKDDDSSPFPDCPDKPKIQPSILGERVPSKQDRESAQKAWDKV